MKKLLGLLLIIATTFAAWPYIYVYRIDVALTREDTETLSKLVDISAVRSSFERSLERDVESALGEDDDGMLGWLKSKANELGAAAVEEMIDLVWVADVLRPGAASFRSRITNTSFERWNVFVVRLGELGEQPVHVKMSLESGNWRVVGIYP